MTEPSEVWASAPQWSVADEWGNVPRQPHPVRSVGERAVALAAWVSCGLALAASLLLFPIGLLGLPVPIAIGVTLANRGRAWPEVLGLAPGASAFLAYVAYRNRDSNPCGDGPITVVLTPGQEFGCGGTSPEPWLIVALLLLAAAAAVYAVALLAEHRNRW